MFEPVRMAHWEAVVLERDLRPVLRVLGALGAVQFTPVAPGPDSAPRPPAERREAWVECRRLRTLAAELRRGLPASAGTRRPRERLSGRGGPGSIPADGCEVPATLDEWVDRTREWHERHETLRRRLGEERVVAERAAAFSGLELPLPELARLERLSGFSGSVPEGAWDGLDPAARPHGFVARLGRHGGRVQVFAVTTHARRPQLEEALRRAGFRPEPLPRDGAPTPEAEFIRSSEAVRSLEAQLRRAAVDGADLAEGVRRAAARAEAFVDDEERILRATEGFPRTRSAVLLSGWVPVEEVARAAEEVRRATGGRCAVAISAGTETRGTSVPVMLRPPGWLRPFARLVEPYGLPRYGEIDPTLFVAVGYLVMFGMMFGDVGHGALLALAGLALRAMRVAPVGRDFGAILGWAGLAAAGFGLVYGSCFGLPTFHAYALWRDPLEGDALGLIRCALALGVGTLGLGIGLNLLNHWRARNWLGLLFDHFGVAGAVFYAAGILWVLRDFGRPESGLPALAVGLGLAVPPAAWCLRAPLERLLGRTSDADDTIDPGDGGVGGAFVESVVGAFEAMLLFLANTVSFVRLAAYALSHAAILAAAFAMADQVRSVPRLGEVLALVLVVAGNLAALVLEGLVAAVQALRLQYYEFLGKFYSGEGSPFTPFRLSGPPDPGFSFPGGSEAGRDARGVEGLAGIESPASNERWSS